MAFMMALVACAFVAQAQLPVPSRAHDAQVVFSASDVVVATGDEAILAVRMANAVDVAGFQCDIILPEGITLRAATLGPRATSSHVLVRRDLADSNVRLLSYSSSSAAYDTSEGPLFELTLDASAAGRYTVGFESIIVSDCTGRDYFVDPFSIVVDVVNLPIAGDADGDGLLTAIDITTIVDYILGRIPAAINLDCIDINADGQINVTDVVLAVNLL